MISANNILVDYLHVKDGGNTDVITSSDSFWQDLASGSYPQFDQGRLMSAFTFSEAWPSWERNPAGEELVMLLSGAAVLVLEENGVEREVELATPGAFVLVPKGTWHTAKTSVSTTMLFLTPGDGTEHRPIEV